MARFALVLTALVGITATRETGGSVVSASHQLAVAGAAAPVSTVAPAEQALAFVPYVSRGHVLVAPTITPTPIPRPTPIPEPEGFEVRCDASGSDEICSWLPSGEPDGGDSVEAAVRLFVDGRPLAGVKMSVRWVFPYPTLFKYCTAETGSDGVAACGVDAPRYPGQYGAAQIALAVSDWPFQRQITFRIH